MNDRWIEELRALFFGVKQEDLNIDAALELKKKHIPPSLYKYREVGEYALKNLEDDTVWCCNAGDFNDPYDSSICFSYGQDVIRDGLIDSLSSQTDSFFDESDLIKVKMADDPLGELIDIAASKEKSHIKRDKYPEIKNALTIALNNEIVRMNKQFNDGLKRGYKICSFSERIDSMLMWSHYANEHKGFALEYNFKELPITDLRSRFIWPVLYDNNLFDASAYFEEARKSGSFNNMFALIASLHKACDWSYEKEWRMVVILSHDDPPMSYQVPKPKAIYLGSKINTDDKRTLVDIAFQKGIDVYQMELSHSEFKMIPSPFSASKNP